MDYSKMTDFEINKRVAEACGLLIQEIDDSSSLGMTTEFHEKYPSVVWVAHFDYSTGRQCEPWWQFDPCNNPSDAWPIIIDNSIQFNYDTCQVHCDSYFAPSVGKVSLPRKQALRAAMIVYLMMKECE